MEYKDNPSSIHQNTQKNFTAPFYTAYRDSLIKRDYIRKLKTSQTDIITMTIKTVWHPQSHFLLLPLSAASNLETYYDYQDSVTSPKTFFIVATIHSFKSWDRVTNRCAGKLIYLIYSHLSSLVLIGPFQTNCREIWIKNQFLSRKCIWKCDLQKEANLSLLRCVNNTRDWDIFLRIY